MLQRKNLTVMGVWVPNGFHDGICMARDVADEVAARFDVELREVGWAKSSPGDAMQLMIPVTSQRWFDDAQLEAMGVKHRGKSGAKCETCGVWRWLPLRWGTLPPVVDPSVLEGFDIVAGPEWFGGGWMAYRQFLVRRELAEFLQQASPRDFEVHEVVELTGVAGQEELFPNRPADTAVPAGAVSEIFVAELLPESVVVGQPSEDARRAAVRARELLRGSNGLISADALVTVAWRLYEGGEVVEAVSLWRQAAGHGSAAAGQALAETGHTQP